MSGTACNERYTHSVGREVAAADDPDAPAAPELLGLDVAGADEVAFNGAAIVKGAEVEKIWPWLLFLGQSRESVCNSLE